MPKITPTIRRLMTIADAAERLGVSTKTIRKRIATGELPAYRIGPRAIRVDQDDVDRLLRRIPTTGVA